MKLQIPEKSRSFLTSCATINLSTKKFYGVGCIDFATGIKARD